MGMYRPAARTIGFSIASTNRVSIDVGGITMMTAGMSFVGENLILTPQAWPPSTPSGAVKFGSSSNAVTGDIEPWFVTSSGTVVNLAQDLVKTNYPGVVNLPNSNSVFGNLTMTPSGMVARAGANGLGYAWRDKSGETNTLLLDTENRRVAVATNSTTIDAYPLIVGAKAGTSMLVQGVADFMGNYVSTIKILSSKFGPSGNSDFQWVDFNGSCVLYLASKTTSNPQYGNLGIGPNFSTAARPSTRLEVDGDCTIRGVGIFTAQPFPASTPSGAAKHVSHTNGTVVQGYTYASDGSYRNLMGMDLTTFFSTNATLSTATPYVTLTGICTCSIPSYVSGPSNIWFSIYNGSSGNCSVQPSPDGVTNSILNGSGTNLYTFGPGTTLFLRHDATNAFVLR